MKWDKIEIENKDGEIVEAQAPIIISASRATDIPAFYSDWFIERIKTGYVKWENPFNGVSSYVSFDKTRLIVFWTKNSKPIIKHLNFLDERIKNYYFQYTLNDYDAEKLEPNVPHLQSRIETFIRLSERIGKEKVVWRFDPLILTDKMGVDELLKKVENIGNQLKNYTEKLVFSFADINNYNKVRTNLRNHEIAYREFNEQTMNEFAKGIESLNENWNFELATCAEQIPLEKYGIKHNKCVDDDLMIKLFSNDKVLMDFLEVIKKTKNNKDKGQRKFCGCISGKDIGKYDTCPHLCIYCYANASEEIVLQNRKLHKQNPHDETITAKNGLY